MVNTIKLPISSSTVSVKIFNAFQSLTMPSPQFYSAAPNSTFDEASIPFCAPGKSFLLEHPDGRKIVFDLGIRKDLSTMAEPYGSLVRDGKLKVEFGPDVAETLVAEGFELESINAVIWSHAHLDHTGNPSTFPSSTALVVGPGTQAHVRPGYPNNPKGMIPESDFLGRDVVEIEFKDDAPLIAGLKTHDYFGDGSFYLLNAPGHCPGHMLGLARTTPTTFILFGADAAHHPALIRPSALMPIPQHLTHLVPRALGAVGTDKPFLDLPVPPFSGHHDNDRAKFDLEAILALDAHEDILVMLSHDAYLDPRPGYEGGIDLLPKAANEWQKHGWKEALHWNFLEKTHPLYRWA